ncbi:MAG TPA: hypothetical protein VJP07_08825 [Dehalococcoidia bacterium]|nr:hypothetical protein [Dehalococcoidia bacterium]
MHIPAAAARAVVSVVTVAVAFIGAAWMGSTPPFEGRAHNPYGETAVVRALPFDAPLPYDMSLVAAGRGDDLPYMAQWTTDLEAAEVAAQFHEHLAKSPRWRLTQDPPTSDTFVTTLARVGSDGYMTHFARLTLESGTGQTIVTFDFTPIPTSLAPD